jgi:butyryl-CoA dehydrogenase
VSYVAPTAAIASTLDDAAGLGRDIAAGMYPDLTPDVVASILDEAGRFAAERLAPLNRVGDVEGARFANGVVATPTGWSEAYRAWSEAGWNAVDLPQSFGGMGMPTRLATACMEMWTSACMAFALGPVLTQGAVDLLEKHGSAELNARYAQHLTTGAWTATMCLTEPQAGSDLGALRTKAMPAGDGTYRLTGQKIFITYGEHDLTENIVHLVLARLPDAPPGTRGISLFLAPRILPDGSRNDLRCAGIERKLGIHGSPTCTMAFGDAGGATAWLVGEPHKGLAGMFTMMNKARLYTGLQGVAIAERACQQALAFARTRRQGRAGGGEMPSIIAHPDVRRNLLTMQSLTAAARALAYAAAEAIDHAHAASTVEARAAADERAGLLTPVVKAWCSDIGVEVASLNVQIHGGMGYVEETGAAQLLRDARITPIYEGTNGIQAIDLVMRKLPQRGGAAVRGLIALVRTEAAGEAVDELSRVTEWLLDTSRTQDECLAVASPYLRLFGIAAGAGFLARCAAAQPQDRETASLSRFFNQNIAVQAGALRRMVMESAGSVVEPSA